jgi:hypothetical protein
MLSEEERLHLVERYDVYDLVELLDLTSQDIVDNFEERLIDAIQEGLTD